MLFQKSFYKIMLQGLSILAPLFIAVYVLYLVIRGSETALKGMLTTILPDGWYVPGMGLLGVAVIVFLFGLLMYPWLTRKLIGWVEGLLRRIPLFGSVYSPVKDLMELLGGGMDKQLGRPVMVKIGDTGLETLGFVTRESAANLPEGFIPDDHMVVFVQWSYQVGGYCFILPKDQIRPLDISVEQGLRWSLTAGLSGPGKNKSGGRTDRPSSSE